MHTWGDDGDWLWGGPLATTGHWMVAKWTKPTDSWRQLADRQDERTKKVDKGGGVIVNELW